MMCNVYDDEGNVKERARQKEMGKQLQEKERDGPI